MSKVITPRLAGGLGNYLFQISAAYAISLRDEKIFKVDISDVAEVHTPIGVYFDNIFRKIVFFENTDLVWDLNYHQNAPISYQEIPKIDGNLKIYGYFQNEKFFLNYGDQIKSLFEVDSDTNEYLIKKYPQITQKKTCSIHVRRGDYLNKQDWHPVQSIEYFKNAIDYVGRDNLFFIFSDDIEWCKLNFEFVENKIFVEENKDFQDFYLMSFCEDNIISNSSFSWWSAYMNSNQNKKVIYPSLWHGNVGIDFSDIGCKNWIKI